MPPIHTDPSHRPAASAPTPLPPLPTAGQEPAQPKVISTAAMAMARSGFRRYPREIMGSIRRAIAAHAVEPMLVAHEPLLASPLAASWLGHASILIRHAGKTILTDPVFSQRIGVNVGIYTFGVQRRLPTINLAALPPIDLILLSHAHFDHLDRPTLRALANPNTTIVTARNTTPLIPKGFGPIIELDWGKSVRLETLTIHAVPTRHWGARTIWDRHRGHNAYLLEDANHKVLFAGDTALSDTFRGIGGTDLSIFGIGAYDPWIAKHASPEQVWEMNDDAGGKFLMPMHHSTFELSDEPFGEPLERLLRIAGDHQDRVIGRDFASIWTKP